MNKEEKRIEYFSHYKKKTLLGFKDFHRDNPHVYEKFKEVAENLLNNGVKRYSSKTIICIMRYEHTIKTNGKPFKISDRYQSLYGRLLAYNDSRFEDFFQFKKRKHSGSNFIEEDFI